MNKEIFQWIMDGLFLLAFFWMNYSWSNEMQEMNKGWYEITKKLLQEEEKKKEISHEQPKPKNSGSGRVSFRGPFEGL